MNITFETDPILSKDAGALARNLGIKDADLPAALQALALVAMAELTDMMTGRDVQKLSPDSAKRRLEHLIVYYYRDRLPTEAEIARLFQITPSRARNLLTNLHAERSAAIEEQERNTIKAVLSKPTPKDEDKVILTISSGYVHDAVKRQIEEKAAGSGLRSITKQPRGIDAYEISKDTYNVLAAEYGLPGVK